MNLSTGSAATKTQSQYPSIKGVNEAASRLASVVTHTPLEASFSLSQKFKSNISLKREDIQVVRSFKIRGAYNKRILLSQNKLYPLQVVA